jgi:PleD family two-component response regulator
MHIIDEKSFKIMVACENQTYRNQLGAKLRFEGFNVEYTEGGFHLMHQLERENDYRLIIIHENMNDMPAYEIISLIRNTKSKSELPIIYISKTKNDEDVCDMVFVGANEFIVHATNFAPLVERVRKYFVQQKNSLK